MTPQLISGMIAEFNIGDQEDVPFHVAIPAMPCEISYVLEVPPDVSEGDVEVTTFASIFIEGPYTEVGSTVSVSASDTEPQSNQTSEPIEMLASRFITFQAVSNSDNIPATVKVLAKIIR